MQGKINLKLLTGRVAMLATPTTAVDLTVDWPLEFRPQANCLHPRCKLWDQETQRARLPLVLCFGPLL